MNDLSRLRKEYADRDSRLAGSDIYSPFNPANLFALQQRQRDVINMLRQNKFEFLANKKILEVGCGGGGVMAEFLSLGASPTQLFGVDLLFGWLGHAHQRLPSSIFANVDGQSLSFPSKTFDLILQFTAVTSVLDSELRQKICADILRVLKPGGMILSYDFWLNPTNKHTRGLRLGEIRSSFPGCRVDYRKITLAPPLARRLVPISWLLCAFLEKLTIFNTHYLVAIRPNL